ncbi:MAG: zinc-ribbon domain-containing protein, partial [Microcystis panniformis]
MSILCTVCVTENPDNANTCTVCGSPLNLGETPSSSTSSGLHLPAGTIVRQGQYKIEKTLGQGGFG